jgi:hypothetical protein
MLHRGKVMHDTHKEAETCYHMLHRGKVMHDTHKKAETCYHVSESEDQCS